MTDLKEAGDNFDEEFQCASGAVENAFSAYVELLEDLRRANDEQLKSFSDERLQNACNLKKLRREMGEMDKIVQNA
jgi:Tfp pilus assembly protein PilO